MISLSRYPHCMEEECKCNDSIEIPNPGNESALSSAVSLQFHRGFYHDRYSDITKVRTPFFSSRGKQQSTILLTYPFSWTLTCLIHKKMLLIFLIDILSGQDSLPPHIVIAPNAGIAAYPSWLPTIVCHIQYFSGTSFMYIQRAYILLFNHVLV